MELQLPSDTVYVPALATMRTCAVNALIRFNQWKYPFPNNNHSILVKQIIAADALGADGFLTYIEGKLCIPKARYDMSHEFESLCRVVRDRYRLATRVVLCFPRHTICYVRKKEFSSPDILTVVIAPFMKSVLPLWKSVCFVQFRGWCWTVVSASPPALWHQGTYTRIMSCVPRFEWNAAHWTSIRNVGSKLQKMPWLWNQFTRWKFQVGQPQQKSFAGEGTSRGTVPRDAMSWQQSEPCTWHPWNIWLLLDVHTIAWKFSTFTYVYTCHTVSIHGYPRHQHTCTYLFH